MSGHFPHLAMVAISAMLACSRDNPVPLAAAPSTFSSTRTLAYIKVNEALDTLETAIPPGRYPIHFSSRAEKTIHWQTTDFALVVKAESILREIDALHGCVATRFFRLDHLPVTEASDHLQKWWMPCSSASPLQAIPDPVTRRVFLIGTPADMVRAGKLLIALDRIQGYLTSIRSP